MLIPIVVRFVEHLPLNLHYESVGRHNECQCVGNNDTL